MMTPMPVEAARLAMPDAGRFQIAFRNQHTGESFNGTYRVGNKYLPDAFKRINIVLRDFRRNEVYPIDPRVIDILYMVRAKTGSQGGTFEVLSGYRSPKTNAMLRKASGGVAKNSLHLTGQAIDIRMDGINTRKLNEVAKSLDAGGVGYYPRSNFVHLDTGRVRHWS
ncbi:MAG: DUF882 domain-containing protein [Alphaproteobacteria bacterium]|nr:DUF882 domain-containing protein [Alphaproteobacteria bacterium]